MSIYSGRIDSIVDQARLMMNDTGASTYMTGDTACLSWINQLISELARNCLFSTTDNLSLVADAETIALASVLTDYVELENLWWNDTHEKIPLLDSDIKYQTLRRYYTTGTKTLAYYLDGTTLYLLPTPSENDTDAILCRYWYLPDSLDGITDYTPPWPAQHDDAAIYYCAWMAYLRERTTPNNLANRYQSLYERAKFRMFANMRPNARIRSYR